MMYPNYREELGITPPFEIVTDLPLGYTPPRVGSTISLSGKRPVLTNQRNLASLVKGQPFLTHF